MITHTLKAFGTRAFPLLKNNKGKRCVLAVGLQGAVYNTLNSFYNGISYSLNRFHWIIMYLSPSSVIIMPAPFRFPPFLM